MSSNKGEKITVIDASNSVLGRLSSIVAKRLLKGEKIVIVNAEKAIISGKRLSVIREYKEFLKVGSMKYGPIHYRRPDNLLRRTIRGMLPMDKQRGKEAFKRLRVFIGVPDSFKDKPLESIPEASASSLRGPYVSLGEVAREIGWQP